MNKCEFSICKLFSDRYFYVVSFDNSTIPKDEGPSFLCLCIYCYNYACTHLPMYKYIEISKSAYDIGKLLQ